MARHLNGHAFTLSIKGLHTEYKSYYTFIVDDLQSVLDEITFTNRGFPWYFIFVCSSRGSVQGWCEISNNPKKNIISIKGKIDERDGILTIEDKKSVLEIVKNTNKLSQDNKHIEVINYDNVVKLEDDLRFNQVLESANYNSSVYYNYLNKHNFTNWHIIEFNSINNCTILYHFQYSNMQINGINYFIKENKIYATLKNNIDGSILLRDNKGKPISIFMNTTLSNSQISLEDLKEGSLDINNTTLHNLSDNIIFVFQKSNDEIFPISLRFLKDSFKYIKSDSGQEHSTSLMNQNQIRFIEIERNISLSSGNNLEQLQVISTTYDINENPYHIRNNGLIINQYGNNSSIHKVMLSNELGTQHINIILNTSCNTFSTHCFTSQYEFNCLNTPIAIKDNTNSTSIRFNQYNYIKTLSSQKLEVQCNDNIVSTIYLKTQQDLVLENLLIKGKLIVDAKNVTILDAINVGDGSSFITVEDNTKDFKITLKGRIHITKNYGTNYRESIIRTNPGEIENDIQLIYEYTEKNNTRIYTVMLEHINERFFQDIQIEDIKKSQQLIHFETSKTKYDWYNSDNDIKSVLRIKVKLPNSKIGTLLINGTIYILNIYNQDEELVLQEIKYQGLQNCSPNTEGLVFKNKLLNCTESYFCYYNFSPLSNIEQEQYLNLNDVSIFWSQDNNHKVLVHYPHCYFMDESKNSENLEHKNVKRETSNILWNSGKKLSNLVNFNLLPGAEGAITDKSKSFNDFYKLIKQFNNHPSDTQIKKQNHETEAENNNIDNNENYNLYYNDIDNSKSSLSDYLLIDDPGNDQGNLQTVINSIDIPSKLSLLTLLIGQFFGTNKALSSNPYISPEQEKNRYMNELSKIVKSVTSEMETKYGKRHITNEELEDILPSLNILFNDQEELNYNNYSTSVLGRITEICNHVYDFFGYETN